MRIRDRSSDVCSSDLAATARPAEHAAAGGFRRSAGRRLDRVRRCRGDALSIVALAPGNDPIGTGEDSFATRLLDWFDLNGRHDLPWQHPRTPYRVWPSEIMLQQTQVRTAAPYSDRFVTALPRQKERRRGKEGDTPG